MTIDTQTEEETRGRKARAKAWEIVRHLRKACHEEQKAACMDATEDYLRELVTKRRHFERDLVDALSNPIYDLMSD